MTAENTYAIITLFITYSKALLTQGHLFDILNNNTIKWLVYMMGEKIEREL